ncbi:DUF4214 domain-containing protein [Noviherbaspirillum sp. CPCC 100848]|uniref:DUF4214 domain-containing protein n=1 Tax=Noviherbaspirillum album TaxID=3080276 RepID=A0ABU6JGW2_9BURK|nr:DUF4214 domain-containing protein [Noviherbaspirillum sp. CPCC 100848]MEC4722904.1 DUF4214 domain-containing protein [Noviherbaspirillum sp. CPCC 100848]
MATVNFFTPVTGNSPATWSTGTVTRATTTEITITNGANSANYIGAYQFSPEGYLLGGTINAYEKLVGGALASRVTGTSVSIETVDSLIAAGDVSEIDAYGLAGADTFTGSAGKDFIRGYDGDDRIDGGGGIDTAVYSGNLADYTIMAITDGPTITGYSVHSSANNEGTDILVNVERLRFADATVGIDTSGNGGQAYRLYQAAFDRVPDAPGLGAQINGLDNGMSLLQIAQNFIDSAEFGMRYGAGLSNEAFVTQLYANVLDRAPDAPGLAVQVNALNSGMSRAQLLVNFSESAENQANIIGVIQDGFVFSPVG